MPPRKLTVQVLERLLTRLEKRMEASAGQAGWVSDGHQRIGSGARLLARAKRYLEE